MEEFNKSFNVEGPLKRVELENELIKEFNAIGYQSFNGLEGSTKYLFGVEFEWETYIYCSNYCSSPSEALVDFFLKYTKGIDENDFEDYRDYLQAKNENNKLITILKNVVRKVYNV